ncbi:hypothetical protein FDP41_012292 [Naegleria fowleri]|uniref:N-acetyltransferase domain-containing protein n=1 Tax=Naegleria fowleri TaxID=5763 RepID=A0A6A5C869_NAEFO|nr:uncharacterized protein FDP41_012292 [Naegleria fowleri]KAF0981635.1 hypothetical protein FDP41_012292 [Naegleria fowleri]CAG4713981.1 unnamed protein product [Naegleria fowleri]
MVQVNNQANLIDHRSFFSSHENHKKLSENQKLRLMGVIDKNVEQLKILNNYIYPIQYRESIYEQILQRGPDFNMFAIFNDIAVGSFSCRIEQYNNTKAIYIMLLGVLPKYRKLGIGKQLMEKIFDIARQNGISTCFLHVQTGNEGAVQFYEKLGFVKVKTLENFYAKDDIPLGTRDAFLMEVKLP